LCSNNQDISLMVYMQFILTPSIYNICVCKLPLHISHTYFKLQDCMLLVFLEHFLSYENLVLLGYDVVSYPRRTKSSATPLQQPENLNLLHVRQLTNCPFNSNYSILNSHSSWYLTPVPPKPIIFDNCSFYFPCWPRLQQ